LKGISTGDFSEALKAILGPQATGLSATNMVRLKEGWKQDYEAWNKRDLSEKHYVCIWVDGIHFNVRLDDARSCVLVIIGATKDGTKELLAVQDGYRESKLAWQEILRDLKARGLKTLPALAVGDGALGFRAAAGRSFRQPAGSVAGFIRRPAFPIKCPAAFRTTPRRESMTCTWRTPRQTP
jgi:transposase-like protein